MGDERKQIKWAEFRNGLVRRFRKQNPIVKTKELPTDTGTKELPTREPTGRTHPDPDHISRGLAQVALDTVALQLTLADAAYETHEAARSTLLDDVTLFAAQATLDGLLGVQFVLYYLILHMLLM